MIQNSERFKKINFVLLKERNALKKLMKYLKKEFSTKTK